MIVYLAGTLMDQLSSGEVIILVNGVGYAVSMPELERRQLPELGSQVEVFTHLLVRETEQQLFGFIRKETRRWFRHFIKLNGVGPKLAMTILSTVSVSQLAHIVFKENVQQLQAIPGIGKRTAERLFLELKRLFEGNEIRLDIRDQTAHADPAISPHALQATVSAALLQLGYKTAEAKRLLSLAMSHQSYDSVEALLKAALQLSSTQADLVDRSNSEGETRDA